MFFISLFFLFTFLYYAAGLVITKRKNQYEARIKKFLPNVTDQAAQAEKKKARPKPSGNHFSWVLNFFKTKKFVLKWAGKLITSGVQWKPEKFFAIRFGFLLLGLLSGIAFGKSFMVTGPLALAGYFLPVLYINKKKKERLAKGAAQLPQALGTMATAMKAGFSFMQAMQLVGKEIQEPVGTEFLHAIKQMNLGVSMEDAFDEMIRRFPNKDLEMIVTALLIQRSTGGNLAELLENMQFTITERIKMKEELNALTSQGKMSAWVISLLPVGLGFLLNLINPEYFSPLLQHPLGIAMLVMGAVSGSIGWLAIRKIVNVEV